MGATYVQEGAYLDYVSEADLPVGSVVVRQNLVGVTKRAIQAGELGHLATRGVFDFPKTVGVGGDGFGLGARVYWDETNQVATWSSGGGAHKTIGKVVKAALDPDATVRVMLTQVFDA